MNLSGRLVSNYAGAAFMALVTVLLVPLYVRLLDAAWGQLALCLTLQGLLLLADGSVSPLVLRDAARAPQGAAWAGYRHYLRWYGAIAIALFLLGQIVLFALRHAIDADLLLALRLALLQFGFQFANGAAIAFLLGQGRQREANFRLVGFAAAKHALALLLLSRTPTVTAYLSAFAAVSALEFIVNHLRLRAAHRASSGACFQAIDSGRRTALFIGASLLGLLTGQLDRVFLALTQPADLYGVYYLAGSVLLSLLSLQVPATRSFLPLIAASAQPRVVAASMLKVLALTLIVPAIVIALFARTVLTLWLHDAAIAGEGAPVLRLLMVALVMNALYAPAGMLLVHAHQYAKIARMNLTILAAQMLVLIVLTPRLGIVAGALAWLACGTLQLAVAIGVWRNGGATARVPQVSASGQEPG